MSERIGEHVRQHVLPAGVATAAAARDLGIGRQALHTFLSGKSRLSAELAASLERVFGANAASLLQMQADRDAKDAMISAASQNASGYLKITATDIENWTVSKRISSRSTLPVLIRRLIHATTTDLKQLDFHGDEEAERKGWDGEVDSETGTAKVPQGKSGWELTSSSAFPAKPNDDISSREKAVGKVQRLETTFVFATGRRWEGKKIWADTKRASGVWKDVRAYDAEDLAQWLEQSPSTQIWFAEQIGRPTSGVTSLGQAWEEWSLACDPILPVELFEGSVDRYRSTIENWLSDNGGRPLIVTADSIGEAIAFLAQAFSEKSADDTILVSTPDAFRRTIAATISSPIIISGAEIENIAGPYFQSHHIVIARPKTSVENDADIELGQIEYEPFSKALGKMGFGHEDVSSYSAQSAQSATILRRLFAKAPSLRRPAWAEGGTTLARKLIPVLLAGAWSKSNKTDCEIVAQLAKKTYDEVEGDIASLRSIPDSPVWAIGNYRGVICRRDALFAAHHGLLESDITDFLEWALIILSEDDPALDLDPEQRWSAEIYGKKREISGALRNAIGEMLILFSVYDEQLFRGRISHLSARIDQVIRDLMFKKDARALLSLSPDFQHLAEASPNAFLSCIEDDLSSADPQVFALLRSVQPGSMGGNDRTTLLWALELLAWDEVYYLRVVRILAKLSAYPITDNWVNKPENSLESLVSCWHPETMVNLEGRIQALTLIMRDYPEIGWRICLAQVGNRHRTATPNNRPIYRSIGQSGSKKVTYEELWKVVDAAWLLLLNFPTPSAAQLQDLIQSLEDMSEEHKAKFTEALTQWAKSASLTDLTLISRAFRGAGYSPDRDVPGDVSELEMRLHELVRKIQPDDVVARHQWLFAEHYVPETRAEIMDEEFDFTAREKWISDRRDAAAAEVFNQRGVDGIIELIQNGNASYAVGSHLANCLDDSEVSVVIERLLHVLSKENESRIRGAVAGLLFKNGDEGLIPLAKTAATRFEGSAQRDQYLLQICFACSFLPNVWDLIEADFSTIEAQYWREVVPNAWRFEVDEYDRMIDRMLRAGRPRAAFAAIRHSPDAVDPFTLGRLFEALIAGSDESPSEYLIDGYAVGRCLAHLHAKKALTVDQMARLEFVFIDALDHSKHGIPNLERRNAANPSSFVELIALMYRRKDGAEDPEQYRLSPAADAKSVLHNVYRVLDKLRLTPGSSEDGKIDVEKLIAWVRSARKLLREISREEIGDQKIGQLLGRCQADADGTWPHKAVRLALEHIGNEEILRGMSLAVYNSRGVVMRGPGGDQERALAAKYEGWAKVVAAEHPFAAKLLHDIKDSYLRDAQWHDTDESVRRRLGRH